jgi:trehalose 6-phosphate synthase
VPKYREYAGAVEAEVRRINEKFGTNRWQPIQYAHRQFSHEELQPLYRAADVCLVTSLHDGMNLVAKEYVAARDDERGVLILSKFTGASRDLHGALVVNPYSAEETSEAIHQALTMSPAKQHQRMKTMRNSVREYNVYRWAAEFLKAVASR